MPYKKYEYVPRNGRMVIDPAKLRYWRDCRELTRDDLAEMCHVSRGSVDSWETGRRCPSPAAFRRLYYSLGIGPEDLLFEGYRYVKSAEDLEEDPWEDDEP